MKMLLTSNGIPPQLKDIFLSLLPKKPEDITVSFITTAAYGEEEDTSWLEEYRQQLHGYGITDIEDLDLKGKKEEELKQILENKDIIFVNGGNTYYLLIIY
jgi:peptidase E